MLVADAIMPSPVAVRPRNRSPRVGLTTPAWGGWLGVGAGVVAGSLLTAAEIVTLAPVVWGQLMLFWPLGSTMFESVVLPVMHTMFKLARPAVIPSMVSVAIVPMPTVVAESESV